MTDVRGYDLIEQFYDLLEVPTLTKAIASGLVFEMIDEADARNYAKVAAVRTAKVPMRAPDGQDATEPMRAMMAHQLMAITTGEGLQGPEHAPLLPTGEGKLVPLTDRLVRHVEWLYEILDSTDVCRRYLAAMPEMVRAEAEAQASSAFRDRFEEVVRAF